MMDEMYGIYEPPKMDKKHGVIYFSCPEWADCWKCTTDCPFNPNACGDGWEHDWQYDEDKEEIVCKKCGQIGDEEYVEVRRSG